MARIALAAVAAVASLALIAGCQNDRDPQAGQAAGSTGNDAADNDAAGAGETPGAQPSVEVGRATLRLAHDLGWGGAENADPASSTPFTQVSMLVYNRLVRTDRINRLLPELAMSWESNAEATEWTFNLRPDVTFHDGSPFTASDVRYSFERIFAPTSTSPLKSVLTSLVGVDVIDPQTVRFRLTQPLAEFPLILTDRRMRIISQASGVGVGTGPFAIDSLDPANITRLTAYDNYWEGTPALAAIETVALPSSQARLAALAAGEIDLLEGLTPLQAAEFVGNDDYIVQGVPGGDWRGIVFQTDVAPYDDVRVRQALRLLVDRRQMVNRLAGGNSGAAVACDSPIWSGDQHYAPVSCEQDLDEARRLLDEAGYGDGLEITISTSDLDPYWKGMVELFQFQAAKVGVDVTIDVAEAAGYWSDVWLVEPAVTTLWLERPAAQILAEAFHSDAEYNETHFDSEEFDNMLLQAQRTLDDRERTEIYRQLQEILRDEGGALIPFHLRKSRVMSADVAGVYSTNQFSVAWHEVSLLGLSGSGPA